MATAARLSVKGHHVTILEQSDKVGGKAGAYRRDGFVFDTGPSLVTLPAVYRDLFLKTGAALEECVDLQPVEPGTSYRWADGSAVTLPGVNPAAAATALGEAFGGSSREDWLALTARAAKIWALTRRPFGGACSCSSRNSPSPAARPSTGIGCPVPRLMLSSTAPAVAASP